MREPLRRSPAVRALDVLLLGTVPGGLLVVSGLSPVVAAPGAATDTGALTDTRLILGLAVPLWVCWRFVASMPAGQPLALGRLTGHPVTRTVLAVVTTVFVLLVALLVTGGAVTAAFLAGTVVWSSTGEGVAGPSLVTAVAGVVLVAVVVLIAVAAVLDHADGTLRSRAGPVLPPSTARRLPWYDLAVPVVLVLGAVVAATLATGVAAVPAGAEAPVDGLVVDGLVLAVLALLVAASWAGWRAAAVLPRRAHPVTMTSGTARGGARLHDHEGRSDDHGGTPVG